MEQPVQLSINNQSLYGILHIPENNVAPDVVVAIVIGGSQTRVGSHRIYVQLARYLCKNGISVFRFDYEGMGDSEGESVGFEGAWPSVNTAIEFIMQKHNFTKVILWSICNGASACALNATCQNNHVIGMILCNPDVRNKYGEAKTRLKYYYLKRFMKKNFWKKLLLFKLDFITSSKDFVKTLRDGFAKVDNQTDTYNEFRFNPKSLTDRVINGITKYNGYINIILSSEDLIAINFQEVIEQQKKIQDRIATGKIVQHVVKGADHTFTEMEMKKELFKIVLHCVRRQVLVRK